MFLSNVSTEMLERNCIQCSQVEFPLLPSIGVPSARLSCKASSRGAYGHDPFLKCFWRASNWFHNNRHHNGTIYNVIILSHLVESKWIFSKNASCPYAPLDEVLRYMSIVISESCNSTFSNFHETSEGEIQNVIKSLSNATCKLDPLPTSMFKDCQLVLIPVITKLVNTSLQTGVVPSNCKHSLLTPRLKKSDLPSQELSSYRPIANLSYLSKIIEKVAVKQVQEYLTANDLYPRTQSAYRCFHSVETALLRVENDLLLALDEHKDAVLVLLGFLRSVWHY